ncbi:hypothetical protein [Donghicola sp. XS_ASV15]|uniref:hypothetical protein n=1 Tax=Donghicola sp. XS_ASV15 TaxID=3241295 RepID=UPI0035136FEC
MEFIIDALLGAGALGASIYCLELSRRLRQFNNLENGVGGAVAVLSAQVDDLTKTLDTAKGTADASNKSLESLTDRAETVAKKLELMVASLHDMEETKPTTAEPIFSHRMMKRGA